MWVIQASRSKRPYPVSAVVRLAKRSAQTLRAWFPQHGGERRGARPLQRVGEAEGAREELAHDVGASVEARLDVRRDPVAQVGVELLVLAAGVLAVAL